MNEGLSGEQRWNEHTPVHFRELTSRSDSLHHAKMLSDFSSQIEADRKKKFKHLANQDYTQLMESSCFSPLPYHPGRFKLILVLLSESSPSKFILVSIFIVSPTDQ